MAESNRTLMIWLARSLKAGVGARASELRVVATGTVDRCLERFAVSQVKEDTEDVGDAAWAVMAEHAEEMRRRSRFEVQWWEADAEEPLTRRAVIIEPASMGMDVDDPSPEGFVSLTNKHSAFMLKTYLDGHKMVMGGMQAALQMQSDVIAQLRDVIKESEGRHTALLKREREVATREEGAEATAATIVADGKAQLMEAGAEYLKNGGMKDILSSFLPRLPPGPDPAPAPAKPAE